MRGKILLTGATGFVGSYLLARLLEEGFEVFCLLRKKNGLDPYNRLCCALESCLEEQGQLKSVLSQVHIVHGDVTEERLGLGTRTYRTLTSGIRAVFHCAALTDFSPELSREQWMCNVQGVENLLRFTLEASADDGFHYLSTAYVAGDRDGVIYEDELDKGQGFNNGYEHSKFMAEKILQNHSMQTDLKITIYRPSIIVGHSQTGESKLFNGIYHFLRVLYLIKKRYGQDCKVGKTLIPLRVLGKPMVTKSFVPIDYVAGLIMKIFLNPSIHGKTYHLINANPPTLYHIKKVMEEVLEITGVQFADREAFTLVPPTRLEQLFTRETERYRPYLLREPLFNDKHTQGVRADNDSLRGPYLDQTALALLFKYAINSHWGKWENRNAPVFIPKRA